MRHNTILLITWCFLSAGFPHSYAEIDRGAPSKFMRHEHDQIYARLERLAQTSGKTGKASRTLLTIMRPHLFKEEEFVLPQLGVLKKMAFGESTAGMTWAIERSEELKKEYPKMLAEHQAIFEFIDELSRAADLEGDQGALDLAAQLKAHIQDEEDIIYPAAILAGEYIKKTS